MRHRIHERLSSVLFAGLVASAHLFGASPVIAQEASTQTTSEDLPEYLNDRGTGLATSMFGTYIRHGEFLIYPFFEYYRDNDIEYSPEELGAEGLTDYRGRYRAKEGLVFFGYGITEDLALEMEFAGISATFDKAPDDFSAVPAHIEESGLGDVEGQLRWRWKRENERRPELFSYFNNGLGLTSKATDWAPEVGVVFSFGAGPID